MSHSDLEMKHGSADAGTEPGSAVQQSFLNCSLPFLRDCMECEGTEPPHENCAQAKCSVDMQLLTNSDLPSSAVVTPISNPPSSPNVPENNRSNHVANFFSVALSTLLVPAVLLAARTHVPSTYQAGAYTIPMRSVYMNFSLMSIFLLPLCIGIAYRGNRRHFSRDTTSCSTRCATECSFEGWPRHTEGNTRRDECTTQTTVTGTFSSMPSTLEAASVLEVPSPAGTPVQKEDWTQTTSVSVEDFVDPLMKNAAPMTTTTAEGNTPPAVTESFAAYICQLLIMCRMHNALMKQVPLAQNASAVASVPSRSLTADSEISEMKTVLDSLESKKSPSPVPSESLKVKDRVIQTEYANAVPNVNSKPSLNGHGLDATERLIDALGTFDEDPQRVAQTHLLPSSENKTKAVPVIFPGCLDTSETATDGEVYWDATELSTATEDPRLPVGSSMENAITTHSRAPPLSPSLDMNTSNAWKTASQKPKVMKPMPNSAGLTATTHNMSSKMKAPQLNVAYSSAARGASSAARSSTCSTNLVVTRGLSWLGRRTGPLIKVAYLFFTVFLRFFVDAELAGLSVLANLAIRILRRILCKPYAADKRSATCLCNRYAVSTRHTSDVGAIVPRQHGHFSSSSGPLDQHHESRGITSVLQKLQNYLARSAVERSKFVNTSCSDPAVFLQKAASAAVKKKTISVAAVRENASCNYRSELESTQGSKAAPSKVYSSRTPIIVSLADAPNFVRPLIPPQHGHFAASTVTRQSAKRFPCDRDISINDYSHTGLTPSLSSREEIPSLLETLWMSYTPELTIGQTLELYITRVLEAIAASSMGLLFNGGFFTTFGFGCIILYFRLFRLAYILFLIPVLRICLLTASLMINLLVICPAQMCATHLLHIHHRTQTSLLNLKNYPFSTIYDGLTLIYFRFPLGAIRFALLGAKTAVFGCCTITILLARCWSRWQQKKQTSSMTTGVLSVVGSGAEPPYHQWDEHRTVISITESSALTDHWALSKIDRFRGWLFATAQMVVNGPVKTSKYLALQRLYSEMRASRARSVGSLWSKTYVPPQEHGSAAFGKLFSRLEMQHLNLLNAFKIYLMHLWAVFDYPLNRWSAEPFAPALLKYVLYFVHITPLFLPVYLTWTLVLECLQRLLRTIIWPMLQRFRFFSMEDAPIRTLESKFSNYIRSAVRKLRGKWLIGCIVIPCVRYFLRKNVHWLLNFLVHFLFHEELVLRTQLLRLAAIAANLIEGTSPIGTCLSLPFMKYYDGFWMIIRDQTRCTNIVLLQDSFVS